MKKWVFQSLVIIAVLVMSLASVGGASAGSGCANSITVQWGDTLSGIAMLCGTTVNAIRAANPGLGWWVYAGQVLCIPSSGYTAPQYNGTYVVQRGDTLAIIAWKTGVSVWAILKANPQIWNADLIYAGQVLNLPMGAPPPPYPRPVPTQVLYPTPMVVSFSTLKIAYKPGLFVRTSPGGTLLTSALDKTIWYYKPNSIFVDTSSKVWVEVKLIPPVKGYSTGWLLVKDQLGKYFTAPTINPPIDP